MAVVFFAYLNWLCRFGGNWTHRTGAAWAVAQRGCRLCPKPFLAVHLMGNWEESAPITKPVNGAIAFSIGGPHGAGWVRASLARLLEVSRVLTL
jgi:hypothetical protein